MMILRRRCQEVVETEIFFFLELLLKAKAYSVQNGEYISIFLQSEI